MENKNYDVDALLKKSLGDSEFSEKPSPELIRRLKYEVNNKERNTMKMKKFMKPSMAVAIALITVLSLSLAAFGGSVWRQLQTRIIEGEGFISEYTVMESDDGYTMSSAMLSEGSENERLVVEIEGEIHVIQDPSTFYNLAEALDVFNGAERPMTPAYLPDGFVFEEARFQICPIKNPDIEWAGTHMYIKYGNGEQAFNIEIREHKEEWGFDVWSSDLEEITINGRDALIGDGSLSLQATANTRYTFSKKWYFGDRQASDLSYDDLIEIAGSLR
jgi:hypothetical protein